MVERRIVHVRAYDPDDPENIVVEFDNGHVVILSLVPKLHDPLFAEIKELNLPRTDGARVYWRNGASLSVEDIFAMLRADDKDEEKLSRRGGDPL